MTSWRSDSLRGRRVVVTGATSGLGLELTRVLAGRGAEVIMACRDLAKAEAVTARLLAKHPGADLVIEELDLSSLDSVARFVARLQQRLDGLDVLVNNAGVMAVDEGRTADGFEMTIGVNHLGPVRLTLDLLDLLDAAGAGRVATMASLVHRSGRLDPASLGRGPQPYRRGAAYSASKLANLLFSLELQRRLSRVRRPITSVAAHPGATATHLGHQGSSLSNAVMRHVAPHVLQGVRVGALPMLCAALDADLPGGAYVGARYLLFGPPRLERPSRRARDEVLARDVFDRSCELVGLDPETALERGAGR